jgi:hypothetical protein
MHDRSGWHDVQVGDSVELTRIIRVDGRGPLGFISGAQSIGWLCHARIRSRRSVQRTERSWFKALSGLTL